MVKKVQARWLAARDMSRQGAEAEITVGRLVDDVSRMGGCIPFEGKWRIHGWSKRLLSSRGGFVLGWRYGRRGVKDRERDFAILRVGEVTSVGMMKVVGEGIGADAGGNARGGSDDYYYRDGITVRA